MIETVHTMKFYSLQIKKL